MNALSIFQVKMLIGTIKVRLEKYFPKRNSISSVKIWGLFLIDGNTLVYENKRAHALYMLLAFSECYYQPHLKGVQAPI